MKGRESRGVDYQSPHGGAVILDILPVVRAKLCQARYDRSQCPVDSRKPKVEAKGEIPVGDVEPQRRRINGLYIPCLCLEYAVNIGCGPGMVTVAWADS